jgi:tetratricopeptide (TPR) repeat protein
MSDADHQASHGFRPVAVKTVIGAHLEKILSSSVFKTADRLRELLRFVVHETMAGRGGELKEYQLAVSVLRKPTSFDPKADPVVRIQMRRLREHLDRYYASEGRYDAVLIEIPKGTYAPTFRTAAGAGHAAEATEETAVVGRDSEVADLRAAFEAAAAGRGQLLTLSGEPGIGKTVVVETFLRGLARACVNYSLARGRCSERLAGSEAYLPILEALETLMRDGEEWVSPLMEVVAPTWYEQIAPFTPQAAANAGPKGSPASQERLKREFVAFLHELARRRPVVIFLDDLHWADASTVDILAYAAQRCASHSILIVATYRPAEMLASDSPLLRVKLELQGRGVWGEMPIGFLSRADVDRYLGLRFPEHLFPPDLAIRVHDRTEGNPLFMTDLVRFLADRGVLAQQDGRWVMRGQLADVEEQLPETVRGMVESKIAQLGVADRRLLVMASVQGYEFDAAVVSRALAADAAHVEERLDALNHISGFVTLVGEKEFPDRTVTVQYKFVHVLYQNALYASLQPTRRASCAMAVAEALLGFFGTHCSPIASELAMLFETARDFTRSADYFGMAAEQATRVAANSEAVVLARRGLHVLTMLPATPENARRELRLRTTIGPALMTTIGWGAPEVETNYTRARDLCAHVAADPQLWPVIYGLWGYWHGRAEFQTAVVLGEQLLALAQKVEDPTPRLLAHYALGNTLAVSGEWERSRFHTEQAIALYDPQRHRELAWLYGGHDPGVVCLSGLPINLWMLGYADQALQRSGEGLKLARQIAHKPSVVFALIFEGMLHLHRRDAVRARDAADAAITLATEQELAWSVAWARVLRGWAKVSLGAANGGIAELREAIEAWMVMGLVFRPHFLYLLADSYATIGRVDEALAALSEALTITAHTHEGFVAPELHRLRGELQGEPADAEACFRQSIEIARRQKAKSFELRSVASLSRLLQKEGRRAEAREMLADLYRWFTEGFDTVDLKAAAALLEGVRVDP